MSGILLWYPVPCTRIPIRLAKGLGRVTASYRWFAVVYILLCFFLLPLFVFGLSLAGRWALVGVGAPLLIVLLIILLINILQKRKPVLLPPALRSWSFLPLWARSLDPWDRVVGVFTAVCCCCCTCCHLAAALEQEGPEQRAGESSEKGSSEVAVWAGTQAGNESKMEERV